MESEFKITQRNLWVRAGAITTAVVLVKMYAVEERILEPVMGDGKRNERAC